MTALCNNYLFVVSFIVTKLFYLYYSSVLFVENVTLQFHNKLKSNLALLCTEQSKFIKLSPTGPLTNEPTSTKTIKFRFAAQRVRTAYQPEHHSLTGVTINNITLHVT